MDGGSIIGDRRELDAVTGADLFPGLIERSFSPTLLAPSKSSKMLLVCRLLLTQLPFESLERLPV